MPDARPKPATVLPFWEAPRFHQRFRTGVSLHGHTSCSREALKFLGGFKGQFPIIPAVLGIAARQHRCVTGETLDIQRASWRPPLDPAAALRVETDQIRKLGLEALTSLTDHDTIEANLRLGRASTPVSVEWTVPFGPTFFHLGVHNLPEPGSGEIWRALRSYTRRPENQRLLETLALVHERPNALIVLNHPLWDEAGIGQEAHAAAVTLLLKQCGAWIHAIELNGLRSRVENAAVAQLAADCGKPLISGGDRHGAEANANINLTNAGTFDEFIDEVRRDGQSAVLFLPQYREPLRLRWLQTVWDIVRPYPESREGWRHWSDRFFYRGEDGVDRPLAEVWKTARPPVLSQALAMLRIADLPQFRGALRLVLAEQGDSGG
ncbi:MAG: hypothetical protein ABSC23_07370 [Bryobacteraceae bacterium]|jgi:hypothetical protein